MVVKSSGETMRTLAFEEKPRVTAMAIIFVCLISVGKNFTVVDLAISQEMFQKQEGFSKEQIGSIFAGGLTFSIFGKILGGFCTDTLGGRFTCLMGMLLYVVPTALMSMIPEGSPFAFHLSLYGINCLSNYGVMGVARIALATNWTPHAYLARFTSLVAMTTDLGDAICRLILAPYLPHGWRVVFQAAAFFAFLTGVPLLLIGDSPKNSDETIQRGKEIAKKMEEGGVAKSFCEKLKPLLSNISFYALLVLSGVLYSTRALFVTYTTSFLALVYCRDQDVSAECLESPETLAATAQASSAFTFFGCMSPLIIGVIQDSLPKKHRALPQVLFMVPLAIALCTLALRAGSASYMEAVILVTVAGICLAGPMKVVSNVFAVDMGGKDAKGTALTLVGIINNLFGSLIIVLKGMIGNDWIAMFKVLSGMSFVAIVFISYIWMMDLKKAKGSLVPLEVSFPAETESLLSSLSLSEQRALEKHESFVEHSFKE